MKKTTNTKPQVKSSSKNAGLRIKTSVRAGPDGGTATNGNGVTSS